MCFTQQCSWHLQAGGSTGGRGAPLAAAGTHIIHPTMPAKLTSGSVSTTSKTPRHASRAALAYSGMKSVECTRQRCAGAATGRALRCQGPARRSRGVCAPAGMRLSPGPGCRAHGPAGIPAAMPPGCHPPAPVAHLRLGRPQVHVLIVPLHVVAHLRLPAGEHTAHCSGAARRRQQRLHKLGG